MAKLQFFEQPEVFKVGYQKGILYPCSTSPNSALVTSDVQKADILNSHSVPRLTSRNIRDTCNIGTLDLSNFPEEFLCTID